MKRVLLLTIALFFFGATPAVASDAVKWALAGAVIGKTIGGDRDAALAGAVIGGLAGYDADRRYRHYNYGARVYYDSRHRYRSNARVYYDNYRPYRYHRQPRIRYNIRIDIR